jgi:hypothetical protein
MVDIESTIDPTRDHGKVDTSSLKNFLSRPVLINSFNIARNSPIDISLNPWQLYMSNPNVKEKLDNFYLFRGRLCIKVILNGSGFYYGHFLAYYIPFALDDELGSFARGDPLDDLIKTVYPHIWLDPTTSRGGEMKVPFYNPHTWISLPEATHRDMGQLRICDIVQLKHANDLAPHSLRVSVFAWFEDVEICHTTSRDFDSLSPQSGMGGMVAAAAAMNQHSKDEYGEGIVSHVSSVAANAMQSLSGVPIIGNFAKATANAAGTIHKFARFLGFSRPRQIEEIKFVQHFDAGHMALTDQHDTSKSLALTSKQELTVDPRVVGLGGTDEMSLQYITSKEAILQTVAVNPATASADDLVWTSTVSPMLYRKSGDEIRFTPMAHASVPFRFWTGSLIFRFQITASAYHRGRFRVTWDPINQASGAANYNLNYSRVVDIAQERDFEIPITWAQFRAWHEVDDFDRANTELYGTSPLTGVRRNTANGVIAMYVVNEIAVPNTAADDDVFVTVTVRAGPDFRLAGPRDSRMAQLSYQSGVGSSVSEGAHESAEGYMEGTGIEAEGKPGSTQSIAPIGDMDNNDAHLYDVYFGEQAVVSIRQLLKRYSFVHAEDFTWSSSNALVTRISHNMPPLKGTGTGDDLHVGSGQPCTYATMNILTWFFPAYTGYRGSLRWKVSIIDSQTAQSYLMGVTRHEPVTSAEVAIGRIETDMNLPGNAPAANSLVLGSLFDGALARNTLGEGTLEFELPFYSNRRFAPCRLRRNTNSTLALGKGHCESWKMFVFGDANTTTTLAKFVAVGEDFSLSFYVGPPRMTLAALPNP